MEYRPAEIEPKWQNYWRENNVYRAENDSLRPKYYVLDMFPYPSGAGLHVGHPLGYIASDIVARYKRLCGYNVLHPMGYDAFGLPAEQYAIQTGQHPATTTDQNTARYREQLDRIGFSFDWSRQVRTCDPEYYRWTQWIFLQLFNAWYNRDTDRAESIDTLRGHLESKGTEGLNAANSEDCPNISASDWGNMDAAAREAHLQHYRLAYRSESVVNWCPALGTVLANDEVVDGVSERGGHPVEQKPMLQWSMRISAYAERLLHALNDLDWSDSIKETQRNWIGRSEGAMVNFDIQNTEQQLQVFTTRPDTLYGVTFMVMAPEHELVDQITSDAQREAVNDYVAASARRSERDRMVDTKTISGAFTGAYATHPLTGQPIPIWLGDYVLASYGTGAVMAVPGHDSRDHAFAKHFDLPIVEVVQGGDVQEAAYDAKSGTVVNSNFMNGMSVEEALPAAIAHLKSNGLGEHKVQYRMRDAVFGRQRYWGEPIPIAYRDGVPEALPESELPLELPEVDAYLPTADGEPPLARAANWTSREGLPLETTTMPGWAGSSWYYLRYMDPHNEGDAVGADAAKLWGQVDLYVGGSEHATGHLLYARFWCHALHDLGHIGHREPFKKLVNQGMIQGISAFAHRKAGTQEFVSAERADAFDTQRIHVDVSLVNAQDELDMDGFRQWMPDLAEATFDPSEGPIKVTREVEKMSKTKYNVINPDEICQEHGADALRLFEMFLGPLEQSKPWDTKGLSGVTGFLRKVTRLMDQVSDGDASAEELKALHKLIKKVQEDMEALSFNTSVSAMMIAVNEWGKLGSLHRDTMRQFVVILSPFAPHLAEEIWSELGGEGSVTHASFPELDERHLVEDTITYPVQFNGKTRFDIQVPSESSKEDVEAAVMADERSTKYLDGLTVRKVIVVPNRIVNIVAN